MPSYVCFDLSSLFTILNEVIQLLFILCLVGGASQDVVLKNFEKEVEGVVNFEVTMDALNKNLNRGFGFVTFSTVEGCKAAHAKYFKDKLKILVSLLFTIVFVVCFVLFCYPPMDG